jgi:hypothetical protein
MDLRLSILPVATAVLVTVLSCISADAAGLHARPEKKKPPRHGPHQGTTNYAPYDPSPKENIEIARCRPRSWDRPLYDFRGGLRGAGASSTDSKMAANIERGF